MAFCQVKESVALDFILDVFATVKAEKVPPTFFLIMPAFLSLLKSELTLKEKVTRFIVNKSIFLGTKIGSGTGTYLQKLILFQGATAVISLLKKSGLETQLGKFSRTHLLNIVGEGGLWIRIRKVFSDPNSEK